MHLRPPSPQPLVLDGVRKRYGTGPFVLDGLSRTVAPGTALGLVGPNGSGKSTLLRLLSVLTHPTEGVIRYGELDIHASPRAYLQSVGIVHDAADLPGFLSAPELLEWIARERGIWTDASPSDHAALLDAVRLDERRVQPIGTYSSGMTRKTQIAAAFAAQPDVLLLDEPFRALDVEATEAAVTGLATFRDAGGTVLLSSHRADLMERIADATLELG
ncbi:MAG: ABC transporter ATP-binding protein [Bacteroidota bacterium]